MINDDIIGSLEIASKLGAKLIVVKGHSHCGAVGLAVQNVQTHNIGAITGKIRVAVEQCQCSSALHGGAHAKLDVEQVTRQNVENSLAEIIAGSEYLRGCIARGEMGLIGAYYDIGTGEVQFGKLVRPETLDEVAVMPQ